MEDKLSFPSINFSWWPKWIKDQNASNVRNGMCLSPIIYLWVHARRKLVYFTFIILIKDDYNKEGKTNDRLTCDNFLNWAMRLSFYLYHSWGSLFSKDIKSWEKLYYGAQDRHVKGLWQDWMEFYFTSTREIGFSCNLGQLDNAMCFYSELLLPNEWLSVWRSETVPRD